jgi:PRTRC genetic system protein B
MAETKLCLAPYWNCYDNGVCCTGSMKIPQEKSVAAIDRWEESFFQSEFTHASGVRKHVRFRGGFLAMWQSLAGQKAFPAKYLVKLPQTLGEFVRNDDHSYRNDNPRENRP